MFLGGGGTPGGDGEKLVDDVVGFTATIWAAGEGEIVGRYAVREIEGAADLRGAGGQHVRVRVRERRFVATFG